jgi:hypothetical protein
MEDASTEAGLEINAEKTEQMFLFHRRDAGQNHNIKRANKSFGNRATKFKYLGTKVINQNCIH